MVRLCNKYIYIYIYIYIYVYIYIYIYIYIRFGINARIIIEDKAYQDDLILITMTYPNIT